MAEPKLTPSQRIYLAYGTMKTATVRLTPDRHTQEDVAPMPSHLTTSQRFWAKVDKNGPVPDSAPHLEPCWLWTASLDGRGYGQMNIHGRPARAPRIAWELAHGPITGGLSCLHHCDTPSCVRLSHLFLGTSADNVRDMDRKGRRVNGPSYGEAHGCAKLTAQEAAAIRRRADAGENQHSIATEFGISHITVSAIKTRRRWGHLPE